MTEHDAKMLIVYYSHTGTTKSIADKLREKTGADIVEIETVRTYPAGYSALTEEAKRELDAGELPALTDKAPDMAPYGLVLVGGPVWWYTLSTPVMSFLKQADFAGRKAAAFCTHEGGPGKTLSDFGKQAKNALVLEGIELHSPKRTRKGDVDRALDAWLGKLREE